MRTRRCTERTIAGRSAKAEAFLDDAELLASDPGRRHSAACLYVDAGIAASDVLCCRTLGEHAKGQDHNDAIRLLTRVNRDRARDLAVLLANKSLISYSAETLSATEFKKVQRAAIRLVDAAR